MRRTKPLPVRLLSRVSIQSDGCWLWQGAKNAHGYGRMWHGDGSMVLVHRASFELLVGEIPKGMLVCHRCDIPKCVRPDHLFLGTHRDNSHDALKKGRLRPWQALKTSCKHGHAFSPNNTYTTPGGKRQCISCRRVYKRQWRAMRS